MNGSAILNQLTQQLNTLWAYLPRIIGAIAVLIIGYFVARILRRATKSLLGKIEIDNRIADMMRGEGEKPPPEEAQRMDVESIIAAGVYYIVLTGVVILMLQTLALTQVIEPLNVFLTKIIGYVPNLIGPALLLLVAWVTATVLRVVVRRGLHAMNVDERFSRRFGAEEEAEAAAEEGAVEEPAAEEGVGEPGEAAGGFSMANSVAEMTYWFVFLLFLPAILDGLRLEGILAPVRGMVNEFLAFVPNLFAAAVIFGVGYFVARLVQRITTSFLASAGADRLTERIGLDEVMGAQRLSSIIGFVVYALILIPVAVAALNALEIAAVTEPASAMLNSFLAALPDIFAAALVVAIAYAAGRLVGSVVETVLEGVGFDKIPERLGLFTERAEEGRTPSEIVGLVVFAAIVLLGTMEGFSTLGFETLAGLLGQFAVFGGKVLLGVAVFGIGLYLAQVAARAIEQSGVANRKLVANIARASIIVLTAAMALREMGIADQIINLAFGLGFGAIAVAVAIAFGLGGREPAGDLFREFVDQFRGESSEGAARGDGDARESGDGEEFPGGERPTAE